MAEEHNKLQDKTSLIESKNQRSRPDLTSNSLSVNAGSQSATLDPEASMNDMGGHYQQHHSQPVQEADRREENSPPRAEEHAQLQRWAYETSNSELTPAERFEKQKWGNEGRSSVNKSEENKRE